MRQAYGGWPLRSYTLLLQRTGTTTTMMEKCKAQLQAIYRARYFRSTGGGIAYRGLAVSVPAKAQLERLA